jgi:hypothetical protein
MENGSGLGIEDFSQKAGIGNVAADHLHARIGKSGGRYDIQESKALDALLLSIGANEGSALEQLPGKPSPQKARATGNKNLHSISNV